VKKLTLIAAAVLLFSAGSAFAQASVRVGYFGNDIKKAFVGADVSVPIGSFLAITPGVDYTRVEGVNIWFAAADLQLMMHPANGPMWWVGAGPTYGYARFQGIHDSDWGWDANAGLGWRMGGLSPYATLRYVKIQDLKTTGVALGLRFGGR
jgi:hypothetical protein